MSILIFSLTSCYSYQETDYYLDLNDEFGVIVNSNNPVLVIGKTIEIDLLPNYKLLTSWDFSDGTLTFSKNNRLVFNNVEIGHWAWMSHNVVLMEFNNDFHVVRFEIHDDVILLLLNGQLLYGTKHVYY